MRQPYLVALCSLLLLGAAPSRTQTYVAGQVIDPADVTENEDNIFSYLQAGVDTYANSTILSAHITNGTIAAVDLANDAVTSAIILNATVATEDLAASAITSALIANDSIVNADVNSAAAIDFSKLATLTSANILVGNSSNVAASVSMSGDVAISNTGATTIQDNSVDGTDLAIGSDAQGDVLYYNGTDYTRLGAGTSGQFLKTNGASANPAWADPGAWVFVETVTFAGDQTKSTSTLPTSSDEFLLVIEDLVVGGGTADIFLAVNAVAANYNYILLDVSDASHDLTSGATAWTLALQLASSNALHGSIWLHRLANGSSQDVSGRLMAGSADVLTWGTNTASAADATTFTISCTAARTLTGEVHVYRSSN